MSSDGPRSPAAGAFVAGAGVDWLNSGNIVSSNNAFATVALSSGTPTSDVLVGTQLGFAIPTTATILGIVAEAEVKESTADAQIVTFRLTKNGTGAVASKTVNQAVTTTDTYYSAGGAADLWTVAWTPDEVNATTFGAQITVARVSGTVTVSVDHLRVTVYYDNPVTFSPSVVASSSLQVLLTSPGEIEQYVASGSDDGAWRTGTFDNTATSHTVGNVSGTQRHYFARFDPVAIPNGATIEEAYLRVHGAASWGATTVNWALSFEAADDPAVVTSVADADGRTTTTPVAWNNVPEIVNNGEYNSVDLSAALQEVVDRSGWASGNALQAFIKDNGSTTDTFRALATYESTTRNPVMLYVRYAISVPVMFSPSIVSASSLSAGVQSPALLSASMVSASSLTSAVRSPALLEASVVAASSLSTVVRSPALLSGTMVSASVLTLGVTSPGVQYFVLSVVSGSSLSAVVTSPVQLALSVVGVSSLSGIVSMPLPAEFEVFIESASLLSVTSFGAPPLLSVTIEAVSILEYSYGGVRLIAVIGQFDPVVRVAGANSMITLASAVNAQLVEATGADHHVIGVVGSDADIAVLGSRSGE